ncbi:ankyrin repeat-containing domain protein [Biscogniauxia mediterranea]|nr:ankyrin repeat-containing domain protein [Biscogniauxia mediterranea]
MSPLHRCQSSKGGVNVAEQILSRCPEIIDDYDHLKKTALCTACEKRNVKMVEFLLEKNAQPNVRGPWGRTPLRMAIDAVATDGSTRSKKASIVVILLYHRADPWIQDGDGRTPFSAVCNAGFVGDQIIKRLERTQMRWLSSRSTASRAYGSS